MAKTKPMKTAEATLMQKILFGTFIVLSLPWSLFYLVIWSGRCGYCGKRIMFHQRICKKCFNNSHAIVDDFDEKIEMFYEQISQADDLTDIITQYSYIFERFPEIEAIYEILDEEVETASLSEKTKIYMERTLEQWYKEHAFQFSANDAYRKEILEEIADLQEQYPDFAENLGTYKEDIEAIVSEQTELRLQG